MKKNLNQNCFFVKLTNVDEFDKLYQFAETNKWEWQTHFSFDEMRGFYDNGTHWLITVDAEKSHVKIGILKSVSCCAAAVTTRSIISLCDLLNAFDKQ